MKHKISNITNSSTRASSHLGMAEKKKAPGADHGRLSSGGDDENIMASPSWAAKARRRRSIKICCCIAALLVILAIVILIILIFTVFRVKNPKIRLNNWTITKLELVNGTIPKPGVNISLIADMSVKNPNVASFKYGDTVVTGLYHRGDLVGEARGPPGLVRAWRTLRMNLTVDLITDRAMSSPNLSADIESGILVLDSYTRVGGRANILNLFKRHVVVKFNCSSQLNTTSLQIYQFNCKRKVQF